MLFLNLVSEAYFEATFRVSRAEAVCKQSEQQAVIMISKGPHLRDQPAEQRTHLTNELLNISPSPSCLLLHYLLSLVFIFLSVLCVFIIFGLSRMSVFYQHFQSDSALLLCGSSLCFTFSAPLTLFLLSLRLFDMRSCAHWNSVGWYFNRLFVNSVILFKQVHQLTHKGVSLLHSCWLHHTSRHVPVGGITEIMMLWLHVVGQIWRESHDTVSTDWHGKAGNFDVTF